jgi:hypothetical protein
MTVDTVLPAICYTYLGSQISYVITSRSNNPGCLISYHHHLLRTYSAVCPEGVLLLATLQFAVCSCMGHGPWEPVSDDPCLGTTSIIFRIANLGLLLNFPVVFLAPLPAYLPSNQVWPISAKTTLQDQ